MIKDFFSKTIRVLKNEENVFEEFQKEKGIRRAVLYFSLFTLFFVLISTNYYLQRLTELSQQVVDLLGLGVVLEIPTTMQFVVIFGITLLLSLISLTFLKYWIVHLYVKLFNRESLYENTYKALSYTVAPGYLAMPFFLLSLAMFPMLQEGLAVWIVFLISVLFAVLLEVYGMYLRSHTLAHLQDLSFWKSFLAIYVLGFITWNAFIIGSTLIIVMPLALVL